MREVSQTSSESWGMEGWIGSRWKTGKVEWLLREGDRRNWSNGRTEPPKRGWGKVEDFVTCNRRSMDRSREKECRTFEEPLSLE